MDGISLIAAERKRQVEIEGWTEKHDDEHDDEEIAWAAVCYATPDYVYRVEEGLNSISFVDPWPWDKRWDKRPHNGNALLSNNIISSVKDRIRQLEKAGALIAAEIDRLQRLAKKRNIA